MWYLAPRSHLPRGTLLLLAHLHRLWLRLGVAKPVVQSIFSKLAPCLAVLVPFSTGDQALRGEKCKLRWCQGCTASSAPALALENKPGDLLQPLLKKYLLKCSCLANINASWKTRECLVNKKIALRSWSRPGAGAWRAQLG